MNAALDDDDFGEHILMLFVGDITSVAYLEPSKLYAVVLYCLE